ncbi:uncharacterized protein LOC124916641 [Impatiens glandulifera]|uniref:uncharacterized protein LOC124916641 n=1 Tax=Impatiens glandulifera TaxID=253017 RepID=UPI001FB13A30|nr:uncharacterized protein LOC124916641 [Impatiens glandulifera]
MAFLFQKFQEAVKILAKSPTFSKDPRHLQFEADINRLFLYTSYNRLGRDAEEADAEEIIDMASKASLSDQHKQVEENIHSQVKVLCKCMDDILLPYHNYKNELVDSRANHRGLNHAVSGDSMPSHSSNEEAGLKRVEMSKRLKEMVGYSVAIKPSGIPHKEAGLGLFLDGEAEVGDVIAFYPGIVYSPVYYGYIPTANNSYLITRYDKSVINGQPWGFGGETREAWKMVRPPPLEEEENDIVEFRNPLAFGHFANHPAKDMRPNVLAFPYDFPLSEKSMRPYIPNITFRGEENVNKNGGTLSWFNSWSASNYVMGVSNCDSPPPPPTVLKSAVLVATRAIVSGEEVLLNYRLSNSEPRPSWYSPVVHEEEDDE